MKKEGLKFGQLVEEISNIIHNNGRFCFSDTLIDITAFLELNQSKDFVYWGVRGNGTKISKELSNMEEFSKSSEFQNIYLISVLKGFWSIELIEKTVC